MRWADSYRRTELSTGEVILGSGSAVIYADMIATIAEDTPRAIALSALGSIVVLLIAFRLQRAVWGVLLPWLLGIAGLFTYLYVSGTKLNFLNFVAVPITVGIGAEYSHNMMQRYRSEGPERIYHVVVETGGAVVLCSLTTTIGYLALTLSINQGIKSFGIVAAVGELAAVLAAVVVLPAALFWSARDWRMRCACGCGSLHAHGAAPRLRRATTRDGQ
jgi:predicted RND superfamily exporter protein